jgi:hypothetical protein
MPIAAAAPALAAIASAASVVGTAMSLSKSQSGPSTPPSSQTFSPKPIYQGTTSANTAGAGGITTGEEAIPRRYSAGIGGESSGGMQAVPSMSTPVKPAVPSYD